MKKRTLKKIVPFGILCFGISLLLWNCEKEEFRGHIVLDETASNYHSRTIALDDIYDVKKYLDNLLPQNSSNKSSEIEGAIFDQDHVLEVIDTLQNTNYSLRFTYPDTPPGEFYNLVIGRTPEGVLKTPFVLKYTCDNNFLEDYIAHDFNMYYFKGMVKMHVYTDFFSVDAFSRTTGSCPPELDAVGDPVACEQAPIDGSDTSGGGGDGGNYGNPNSNPGNDSGGTGGFNITITDEDCLCHSTHAAGGCTHPTIVIIISGAGGMQRSVNTNTDDCPACADANTDGGIGVNEPSMESMRVDLIHRLQMNDSNQINWVNDDMNNQNVIDIISFLNLHKDPEGNDTLYAINFAEMAIDALMNNRDVYFEDLYIPMDTPDSDYFYQGSKQLISNPLVLSNGTQIDVTFGTSKDNINANQPVALDLIEGLKFALQEANDNLSDSQQINTIHISTTTNGHSNSNSPNHPNGVALDISRINGVRMIVSGLTDQIKELQIAFDNIPHIRENFGPYFKHKYLLESDEWDYNWPVGGHLDHVHISIRK